MLTQATLTLFQKLKRNVEIGPNLNAKPRSSNWAFFYETDTTKAESWEKIEGHQFDPVSLACTRQVRPVTVLPENGVTTYNLSWFPEP